MWEETHQSSPYLMPCRTKRNYKIIVNKWENMKYYGDEKYQFFEFMLFFTASAFSLTYSADS